MTTECERTHDTRMRTPVMLGAWWLAGWAALGFGSGLVLGLWLYGWRP